MKKKLTLLTLCAAMGVGMIALAQNKPAEKPAGDKPTTNAEMAQMRDEINRLKAKVELLEYRTKSLESTVAQMKRSHTPTPLSFSTPTPSVTIPQPQSSPPPKIWGQGEVNGWTYYIVPLSSRVAER